MITILHGGQTGVDRGAHEGALDNGWTVAGYMTRDRRDEMGAIPPEVARFLTPDDKTSYSSRTEANVRSCTAVLIVVKDANYPRVSPGTAKTIDLAEKYSVRRMIVDPSSDARRVARWIWYDLMEIQTQLRFNLETHAFDPVPTRLLVAGPRESKWPAARIETAGLLRRIAQALIEIGTVKAAALARMEAE
jgi:hypothetical protein